MSKIKQNLTVPVYTPISFEDAYDFLNKQDKNTIQRLTRNYGVVDLEELAFVIDDDDLYNLGFEQKDFQDIEKIVSENYSCDFDEVLDFLGELDEDVLNDLFIKFDTHDLKDLATALTDDEIIRLGFMSLDDSELEEENEEDKNDSDVFIYDNSKYDEDLDYLEDIIFTSDFPVLYIFDKENNILGVEDEVSYNKFKKFLDPNLVQYCEPVNNVTGVDCFTFKVYPCTFDTQIREDVIINKTLNPSIFNTETETMIPEVREKLMEYINKFVELMNTKSIPVDYTDIQLIGSNAGYIYTPDSDIDIHFIWAYPLDIDNFEQLRTEFNMFTDTNPLLIGQNLVELNLEDDFNMKANSKRRYSIIDDAWIDESNLEERYTESDLSKVEGYEDVVKQYTDKINEVIKSDEYTDAVLLKQEIRQNRSEDLVNKGSLSMGNVVFKELRNNGSFGKLRDYIKSKEILF